MQIKDMMTPAMCKSTIGGWIWYCDSCDTHGNANSSDEAEHMAEAHALYHSWDEDVEYDEEKDPDGENITSYMELPYEEREFSLANWSMECLQATYLISVNDNITYNYGDDYEDKTIRPIDLEVANEIKKRMGLA
jgi:hypothetical protein